MKNTDSTQRVVAKGLLHPALPVFIFSLFLLLALGLRFGQSQQDSRQIQAHLNTEAEIMANNLQREFNILLLGLRRSADRLHFNGGITEAQWRNDARNYLQDFRVYQAIEWIDRDFYIRWIEQSKDWPELVGYKVAFNVERVQALKSAMLTGNVDVSGVIPLYQGGRGIVVYAPVGTGDDNNGLIGGVFQVDLLVQTLLNSRALALFQVDIYEDGKLESQLNPSLPISSEFSSKIALDLPTIDWSLTLRPSHTWVQNQRSPWAWLTLASLLTLGLVISVATLLAQGILSRNQALLKTRSQLDREIAQRSAIQQDLARLESTDPLTGLANRRFFMDDLSYTLSMAERKSRQVALIMLGLDRFQMLNDSLGHQVGDEILSRVAERLSGLADERIMVAYAGGDEFLICQQQVTAVDDVIHLLGRVKQTFAQPFGLPGNPLQITATMGVAVYPQSGPDAETLLRNTDIALYRAKQQARNSYQFYTEGMQEREVLRLELEKDLSLALSNNEFVLYYQPQLNLHSNRIDNVEALIRWQHPRRGLLTPGEFIPLAEESGRITDIGRWVVTAACNQLSEWRGTPYQNLQIAVNLSGRELENSDLLDYVQSALATTGVAPQQLEIELTEEIFVSNIHHNLDQLKRLRQLGVRLAIDDFGVGYSSLSYLKDFPIDLLKIDRSFITQVTERQDDATITSAIINLAHNLGIQVVAEGVETTSQLSFLRQQGCDVAQGYLISRPIPADQLEQWLKPRHAENPL
ncbi:MULTISPECIES: EAL domain-containing protein [unclassified Marinobacter]|uniref:bifunctional diguanylate cyclase/phosphodiesterase n=1 Tax=unclassified Marinobacter TaxID=83889 RepID=UPI000BF32683|nr:MULTISPECIES: EAL domain-containing protein [unclassified Marinobacter]PFG10863.1 diguanylate cyclase (GGDEF)-like protein [Marinobacter sp. LV10MA510-1]PFG52757.1 diguanylate cyclase (GGDEF)-like protein [Marinobacter sp. LV10R520-4]